MHCTMTVVQTVVVVRLALPWVVAVGTTGRSRASFVADAMMTPHTMAIAQMVVDGSTHGAIDCGGRAGDGSCGRRDAGVARRAGMHWLTGAVCLLNGRCRAQVSGSVRWPALVLGLDPSVLRDLINRCTLHPLLLRLPAHFGGGCGGACGGRYRTGSPCWQPPSLALPPSSSAQHHQSPQTVCAPPCSL